jgi:hypothetical protein
MAVQAVNDEESTRAIEEFRAAHPDDACIDRISIDDPPQLSRSSR